ncbi:MULTISPECIES: LysR family transcriptional regulator [Pseudofrankia]|uniref:LysR family transcriptional regulator n=1 Tax=Pseudofrankia TaxID=2994363 RepID=UPI000234CD8B|nr:MULTISPECIES: LysR substrate-binding domain-containing protein [Pseudofrankia]OHV31566.1 LysR family transcriptional regulator [Pseudofrankia sp. EUN1h]
MEPRRLEHFLAVAEEGGFTRAAARLHMVQSGVSASIRSLERELGVDLFERTTQHVELTEAGRALVPEARRVLGAVRQARQVVTEVREGARGTFSLGILHSLTPGSVLAALAAFRAEHPYVQVQLATPDPAAATSHAAMVRAGELDLAVLITTGPVRDLRLHALHTGTVALACAVDHPLAASGRAALTLEEAAGLDLIEFPTGWGVRAAVDKAFAAAGLAERGTQVELSDLATVVDLVRYRIGCAFVPASLAERTRDIRFLAIEPHPPRYQVVIATRPGGPPSATAAQFLDRCLRLGRAA